jgi:IS5 family transposase
MAESSAGFDGARRAGAGLGRAPLPIVKSLFRHSKLRYRGLFKNTAQLHTLFALANRVISRKSCLSNPGPDDTRALS